MVDLPDNSCLPIDIDYELCTDCGHHNSTLHLGYIARYLDLRLMTSL